MTDSPSAARLHAPEAEATGQPTRIAYTIDELCQVVGISRAMI